MKLSSFLKASAAVAGIVVGGLLPVAGIVGGAILGATAASTTAGAVGLGVAGFIGGGVAGTVLGAAIGIPSAVYLGVKTILAFFKANGMGDDATVQQASSSGTALDVSEPSIAPGLAIKSEFNAVVADVKPATDALKNVPKIQGPKL